MPASQQGAGAEKRDDRLDARRARLEHGADRRGGIGLLEGAKTNAREVAYRAGVWRVGPEEVMALEAQTTARSIASTFVPAEEYAGRPHWRFPSLSGGALVQEIDMAHRCAGRGSC